jgi:hypothetical protein
MRSAHRRFLLLNNMTQRLTSAAAAPQPSSIFTTKIYTMMCVYMCIITYIYHGINIGYDMSRIRYMYLRIYIHTYILYEAYIQFMCLFMRGAYFPQRSLPSVRGATRFPPPDPLHTYVQYVHAYIHACMHTNHTCVHTYNMPCMRIYVHTYTCTHITHTQSHTHAHTHTHTHTYIHTYIHTYNVCVYYRR